MRLKTTKVFAHVGRAVADGFTTISAQGGGRSGKTYNIIIYLISYCLIHPGTRVTVVRKALPALRRSVLLDFLNIIARIKQPVVVNKTDLTYKFYNGSWFEFFSCDDEQKLRGSKRDVLFVNEANEISAIEWQQLKLRTTRYSIIDYNPSITAEHWICDVNKAEGTYHFITTYKDNCFLEKPVIDEIESLQHKNKSLWQIYGLGQQAVIEGVVFPNIELVDKIPFWSKSHWTGIDFGFSSDPTAIVEVATLGNSLYIDELCYQTRMLTSDIVSVLKELPQRKVISESADPRLVEEIYMAGIDIHPVQKYPGSIQAGISKMMEYTINVTRRSENVIKEFRNYVWAQDKEGKWLNQPVDCWNHAIDAVRYVVLNEVLGQQEGDTDFKILRRLF